MTTGENEQGLRKIIDLTRLISVAILLLHYYYYCYGLFKYWGFTATITDRLLHSIAATGLLESLWISKGVALAALVLSLLGLRGKKGEHKRLNSILGCLVTGLFMYFGSYFLLELPVPMQTTALAYICTTTAGYITVLAGGAQLSRIIVVKLSTGVFNTLNETFPQEERLLQNEYSINLPARYNLKGKNRKSWINIINPFRGLLIMGTPGSGKSFFIVQHIIRQHIEKGFSMFIYDFKFDDLTRIAYNHYLRYRNNYNIAPEF